MKSVKLRFVERLRLGGAAFHSPSSCVVPELWQSSHAFALLRPDWGHGNLLLSAN